MHCIVFDHLECWYIILCYNHPSISPPNGFLNHYKQLQQSHINRRQVYWLCSSVDLVARSTWVAWPYIADDWGDNRDSTNPPLEWRSCHAFITLYDVCLRTLSQLFTLRIIRKSVCFPFVAVRSGLGSHREVHWHRETWHPLSIHPHFDHLAHVWMTRQSQGQRKGRLESEEKEKSAAPSTVTQGCSEQKTR